MGLFSHSIPTCVDFFFDTFNLFAQLIKHNTLLMFVYKFSFPVQTFAFNHVLLLTYCHQIIAIEKMRFYGPFKTSFKKKINCQSLKKCGGLDDTDGDSLPHVPDGEPSKGR